MKNHRKIRTRLHPLLSQHPRDQTGKKQQLLRGWARQLDHDESATNIGGDLDRLAWDEELNTFRHAHSGMCVAIKRTGNAFGNRHSDCLLTSQDIDRVPAPATVYHRLSRMDTKCVARIMLPRRMGSTRHTEVQLADGPPQEVHNLPWGHAFEFGN